MSLTTADSARRWASVRLKGREALAVAIQSSSQRRAWPGCAFQRVFCRRIPSCIVNSSVKAMQRRESSRCSCESGKCTPRRATSAGDIWSLARIFFGSGSGTSFAALEITVCIQPRMVLARFKLTEEGRVKIRPHFSKSVFEWKFVTPPPG